MKAKDYAKLYEKVNAEKGEEEAIYQISNAFLNEIEFLIKSRNCQSDMAVMSVFKELDKKWKVLSIMVSINPEGFQLLVEGMLPKLFAALQKVGMWVNNEQ
jgi:hypothetical protein